MGIFHEKLINPKSYLSVTDLLLLNAVSGFTEADPGANPKRPNFPKFPKKLHETKTILGHRSADVLF